MPEKKEESETTDSAAASGSAPPAENGAGTKPPPPTQINRGKYGSPQVKNIRRPSSSRYKIDKYLV